MKGCVAMVNVKQQPQQPPQQSPQARQDLVRRLSNRSTLSDDNAMQFGKHAGKRLGDVPDHYWRWFLSQEWCDNWPELVEYANQCVGE